MPDLHFRVDTCRSKPLHTSCLTDPAARHHIAVAVTFLTLHIAPLRAERRAHTQPAASCLNAQVQNCPTQGARIQSHAFASSCILQAIPCTHAWVAGACWCEARAGRGSTPTLGCMHCLVPHLLAGLVSWLARQELRGTGDGAGRRVGAACRVDHTLSTAASYANSWLFPSSHRAVSTACGHARAAECCPAD